VANGKPRVKNPYNCVVGCTSCANLCIGKDIEIARGIYKKEGIWGKVKDVLKKNGKIK